MPFIRVRDKDTKHEYDAPVSEVEANPGLYEVLGKESVDAPEAPVFHAPAKKAK
jgi:hypothetical protein